MPSQLDLLDSGRNQPVLTVTELNAQARLLLEERFAMVWVQGEVSNLRQPSSGHWYFTLKDAGAQLRSVMFRNRNRLLRFALEDGLQVVIRANVSLYEERGEYQAVVQHLQPAGDGALRLAFEQLKTRLEGEGLFARERKRSLPRQPRHIAIVTSRSGAALHDMLIVAQRRNRLARITLLSAIVQGEEAPASICAALAAASRLPGVDLIICGRGGGSLEDLWAFNDERVARALVATAVPVISAVGHEVDITIADLVADLRAATPSAAMELALPDQNELAANLAAIQARLLRQHTEQMRLRHERSATATRRLRLQAPRLQAAAQRLDALEARLRRAFDRQRANASATLGRLRARLKHPGQRLVEQRERTRVLHLRLARATRSALARKRQQLQHQRQRLPHPQPLLAAQRRRLNSMRQGLLRTRRSQHEQRGQQLAALVRALQAVSPLNTLQRGYAIVVQPTAGPGLGHPLTNAAEVAVGTLVLAQLASGQLACRVETVIDAPATGDAALQLHPGGPPTTSHPQDLSDPS